jgi:hypothetical protein
MKNWFSKNFKTVIILAFLIPIITVAIVSISHVTKWYGISNPVTWALYLSVGIEIAALSALAAISADMGKKVYFPFGIVTLVQFIGNIFFAYSYIDINGESFKSWVELTSPLVEFMGVDPNDFVGHKRFLAFFAGGMLPIISLSFLHMLVKFIQNSKNETNTPIEPNTPIVEAKDIVGEVSRIRLSEDDLSVLEEILSNPPKPNEELVKASEEYKKKVDENFDVFVPEPVEKPEEVIEQKIDEPMDENSLIIDLIKPEETQIINEPQPINEPVTEFVSALGDDEVREMFLDEWERKFDLVEDEEVIPETTSIPPVVEETPIIEEPVITPDIVVEETPTPPVVEESIPSTTPDIVVEETPIIIPIVEEPIVEEVVTEIIPETSVGSLSETTDEEKKN